MSYLLPADAAEYVRLSGQTIQATATDQDGASSQHVLFLASEVVRSMLLSDWTGPQPAVWDAVTADWVAAQAAYDARQTQQQQAASALRTRVRQLAQGTAGQNIDVLTAAQIKALLVVLLWKNGALDASGVVQPLDEWAR